MEKLLSSIPQKAKVVGSFLATNMTNYTECYLLGLPVQIPCILQLEIRSKNPNYFLTFGKFTMLFYNSGLRKLMIGSYTPSLPDHE